jgi:hypothetical protein
LPNVILVATRYLLSTGNEPQTLDALRRLVAPSDVRGSGETVDDEEASDGDTVTADPLGDAVQFGVEIGLFSKDAQDRVSVAYRPDGGEGVERAERTLPDARTLSAWVRTLMLECDATQLWKSGKRGQDLVRAVAWFMMQDAWSNPFGWDGPTSCFGLQQSQFGGGEDDRWWVVKNSTQWRLFARWAKFLGFAGGTSKALILDPTDPIEFAIRAQGARPGVPLPLPDVLDGVVEQLPVLDGGVLQQAVMKKLPSPPPSAEGEALSSALSHALGRLEKRGFLSLEFKGDAPRVLHLRDSSPRPVSHVSLIAEVDHG